MITEKTVNVCNRVAEFIRNRTNVLAYSVTDFDCALTGGHNEIDEKLCEELGYAICPTPHHGGNLIAHAGDLGFYYFSDNEEKFIKNFVDYFVSYLRNKGLNAYFDDNDVMIDGYKVCGVSLQVMNNFFVAGAHIGVHTNVDNVKKLCTNKPCIKEPKGIAEYGITTEELVEMLKDFANKYNYANRDL